MRPPHFISKAKVYLLLLSLGSLLCSCQSEDFTSVEGYITDFGNGEPIEGAVVHLQQGFRSGGFGGQSSYVTLDSAITNSDGYYRIEHDLTGVRCACVVDAFKEGYVGPPGIAIGGGDEVRWDDEMKAFTYIKWHVKNVNPFDDFDRILFSAEWGGGDPNAEYIGTDVDFVRVDRNSGGNLIQDINWIVRRNGITMSYSDSMYTPAFDTTLVEIFY